MLIGVMHDTDVPLTHSVPQATRPAPQLVQVPFEQICEPLHQVPHLPQFSWSVSRSLQAPRHSTSPLRQSSLQVPSTQMEPGPQAFPHAPQWSRSVCVSRQAPPQSLRPTLHSQLPPLQISPGVQA